MTLKVVCQVMPCGKGSYCQVQQKLAHQLLEAEKKRAQGEADVERRMTSLMESIEEQVPTSLFR